MDITRIGTVPSCPGPADYFTGTVRVDAPFAGSDGARVSGATITFDRRAPRANDMVMEILYCGVCHSDLHWARNDWGWTVFLAMPGHEIVGRVIDVGPEVTRYKIGDHVAVGCMVDSCQHCGQCKKGEEQLCRDGNTGTYGGFDHFTKEHTLGGYMPLLDVDGTLVIVGQIGPVAEPSTVPLILGRRRIAGSPIGGIRETQEMLDFCAKKNILPDVKMIRMDEINHAFERLERADVRYRFVIDMASLEA